MLAEEILLTRFNAGRYSHWSSGLTECVWLSVFFPDRSFLDLDQDHNRTVIGVRTRPSSDLPQRLDSITRALGDERLQDAAEAAHTVAGGAGHCGVLPRSWRRKDTGRL